MNNKNKILFLLHLPPPIHGASMMGKHLKDSDYLKENFNCYFINMSASNKVDEVGKLSIRKMFFLITNLYNILKVIRNFKPDLCYITPTSDGIGFYRDFITVKLLQFLRIKLVLHFHNKASKKFISSKIHIPFLKSFYRNLKIILLDETLYAEKSPYISLNDVYFCPNGIPCVNKNTKKINKNLQTIRFLFLSNMLEAKGVLILLEACHILHKKGYSFKCDFVGQWKDISEEIFNSKIQQYHLEDKVKAHGPKYGIEKTIFFEKADIFVFPTFYHGETFGLVLLEAMDYYLPSISTNNGGIKNIVKNEINGFCIEQKNLDMLIEKMEWFILHPEEIKRMGENGKKIFMEKYTLEVFEKNIVNIFRDIL